MKSRVDFPDAEVIVTTSERYARLALSAAVTPMENVPGSPAVSAMVIQSASVAAVHASTAMKSSFAEPFVA